MQKGGVGGVCAIFFIKLLKTCKMYRTSTHPITGNSHWSEIIKQQQVTSKLLSPPFPRVLEPTRIHANNINFYLIGKYHSLVSPTALLFFFFCFSRLTVCMESWLYLISKKRACQVSLLGIEKAGMWRRLTVSWRVSRSLYQLSIHKFKIWVVISHPFQQELSKTLKINLLLKNRCVSSSH